MQSNIPTKKKMKKTRGRENKDGRQGRRAGGGVTRGVAQRRRHTKLKNRMQTGQSCAKRAQPPVPKPHQLDHNEKADHSASNWVKPLHTKRAWERHFKTSSTKHENWSCNTTDIIRGRGKPSRQAPRAPPSLPQPQAKLRSAGSPIHEDSLPSP